MFSLPIAGPNAGQDSLVPDHISDESVARTNGADYLFFDALRFIFKVATSLSFWIYFDI